MIPNSSTSRRLRRRGLATVATAAGVGATLSLIALSTSTVTTASSAPSVASLTAASTSKAQAPTRVAGAAGAAAAPSRQVRTARSAERSVEVAAPATAKSRATTAACGGAGASADAFLQHFYAAHLETSPGQQVTDALDADQYAKTHTVMAENMLDPLVTGGSGSLDAFLQHFYAAHLETSPGQQVTDALDADQYAKTHTVMAENMLDPLLGSC